MELLAAQREFVAYGPSHLVVLVIFVVGAALLVWGGRRLTESQARLFGRAFAVVIVASFLVALTYKLINRDLQTSIPLQLCDVAELIAALALWTQRHWAFVLTYYWCLVLSSQALITPDVGTPKEGSPDFPNHLFLTFFVLHVLVVWAAIYLTWGRRKPAELARLPFRHHRHAGMGGLHLHLQRDRRNQLRLPQREAAHRVSAGLLGPVAGVSARRDHNRAHCVGTDHLAVATESATSPGRSRRGLIRAGLCQADSPVAEKITRRPTSTA